MFSPAILGSLWVGWTLQKRSRRRLRHFREVHCQRNQSGYLRFIAAELATGWDYFRLSHLICVSMHADPVVLSPGRPLFAAVRASRGRRHPRSLLRDLDSLL